MAANCQPALDSTKLQGSASSRMCTDTAHLDHIHSQKVAAGEAADAGARQAGRCRANRLHVAPEGPCISTAEVEGPLYAEEVQPEERLLVDEEDPLLLAWWTHGEPDLQKQLRCELAECLPVSESRRYVWCSAGGY